MNMTGTVGRGKKVTVRKCVQKSICWILPLIWAPENQFVPNMKHKK